MKIAFCLFKYFPFGGLQRDFRGIAEECLRRGFIVDVFTLEWEGEVPAGFNVNIVKVNAVTNHRRYSRFAEEINKISQKKHYDVVIGFNKMPYLDIYYAADPCYEAMVTKLRHPLYRLTPRYRCFSRLEKAVFGPGSRAKVFVIAKGQYQEIEDCYQPDEERFYLLPPWITRDRTVDQYSKEKREKLRAKLGVADDQHFLLMVGSGYKTKGLDRALLALASLPEKLKNKTRFFIVGQDKAKPFENMAKSLGIEKQVSILGGRTDVPNFLFAADLLLHAAYCESAGIAILESVVAGLPVITTDVCGYATHVEKAQAGVVLGSPYKQKQFNQVLQDALQSTEKLAVWKKNGINYSQQRNFYEMPRICVDVIEQLAGKIYRLHRRRDSKALIELRADLLNRWPAQNSFDQVMKIDGQVFRELDGRKTIRFKHDNRGYFAKLHFGVGWREIFKNIFQLRWPVTGAKNEWLAIEKLTKLKIDTLRLVGHGAKGKNPAQRKSFIITEELLNTKSLEDFCMNWPQEPPQFVLKKNLLIKVAQIARGLHLNGVNHRDFYICHFLLKMQHNFSEIDPDQLKLFLIDLHRVQLRKKTPKRWIVKDLGSLYFSAMNIGLNRKDLLRFMKVYQDLPLHDILKNDLHFWQQVQKRATELYQKAFHTMPVLALEEDHHG